MINSLALTIDLPKHILDRRTNIQPEDRHIYLNSLALYAADWYLQCLQFETQHEDRADWWIPYLTQAAPLEIGKIGKLECIPVIGDTKIVTISPDLKTDRIGYLFVRLNESLTSAQIIGFTPKYSYQIELDRLQSTDDLIDYLYNLETQSKLFINMGVWFAGIFDGIWLDADTLPLPPTAYRSRRRSDVLIVKSIERRKEIKLGDEPDSPSVVLTILNEQIDDVNSDITLGIAPKLPDSTLPIDLKFIVLDEHDKEIESFELKAGDLSGEIVLDNGKKGEQFSLEIEFDRVQKIGTFEVGYTV